jgi:enamine deaminase RidA (YjgF/YER057c/UK114 family)
MSNHRGTAVIPAGMEACGPVYGFAPGRIVNGLLFVAGQIGINDDGSFPKTQAEQATLALKNVEAVLKEAGCTFADIIQMNTYHVGDNATVNEWFLPLKKDMFADPYPAWTSCGVTSLALDDALIEISAIAVVPPAE